MSPDDTICSPFILEGAKAELIRLRAMAAAWDDIRSGGNFFTILYTGGFQMTDIIDFEDKRKKKLGKQNETKVKESNVGAQVHPDSGKDFEENRIVIGTGKLYLTILIA